MMRSRQPVFILRYSSRAVDELIRVISNSNIAISVDEIEALVGDSADTNIEPEPSKYPEDVEGITSQTTFSYPPLDPVSVRSLRPDLTRPHYY